MPAHVRSASLPLPALTLAFAQGFGAGAALIVAIGAQNAFVLRQGIQREHVLPVVAVCALSDALLIALGVAGLGAWVQGSPVLLALARWGGALFLGAYALLAARRAWRGEALDTGAGAPLGLRAAVLACLAFTYLNPHCWLDTVVLLGSIASQLPADRRPWFGAGAASASAVWFFTLGYGARALRGVFAQARAWRWLDGAIAVVMGSLAVGVARGA